MVFCALTQFNFNSWHTLFGQTFWFHVQSWNGRKKIVVRLCRNAARKSLSTFNIACPSSMDLKITIHIQCDQKVSMHLTIKIPTKLMIWRWPSQNTFGMWTVLYWTRSSRTQFSVSINVCRVTEDTLNTTCNFLYCNHQEHRDFLITLSLRIRTLGFLISFTSKAKIEAK